MHGYHKGEAKRKQVWDHASLQNGFGLSTPNGAEKMSINADEKECNTGRAAWSCQILSEISSIPKYRVTSTGTQKLKRSNKGKACPTCEGIVSA
jgi:hypothetical protein